MYLILLDGLMYILTKLNSCFGNTVPDDTRILSDTQVIVVFENTFEPQNIVHFKENGS